MASLSLNTGLKALLSARYVLDTVGHNVANANTPGYSRQNVHLESSLALPIRGQLIGSGVDVGRIERSVDRLLNSRINAQQGVFGGLESRYTSLTELETFLGGSSDTALTSLFDNFFTSVSDLSTSPSDSILRTGLVQSANNLTSRFHEISSRLAATQRETGSELRARVNEVNAIASEIVELNVEIAKAQSTGTAANDLLDKRDAIVQELSELVDITVIDGANTTIGVLVAGNTLVGQSRANQMSVESDVNGNFALKLAGSKGFVPASGGAIGGLMEFTASDVPLIDQGFDELAHQLVLAVNRVHSVGVPADGPFSILTGSNRLRDFDGDGKAIDELVSNAGLPFDVTSGSLWVNVENLTTGELVKHEIEISRTHTTVADFLGELNQISSLSADMDASGRIRIVADTGFGFDFSARIEPLPDVAGVFGGGQASLAALGTAPYALADGDTLTITEDPLGAPNTFTVTFDQSDFQEISQATADEVAAAINADPNALANGIVAVVSGETVAIQTLGEGAAANLEVSGGSAVGALGWAGLVGAPVSGHSTAVEPKLTGIYSGETDDTYTFRPVTDGTIGTTKDLVVEVLDSQGDLVTTLNVGEGYVPGTELAIADGVSVSFGLGELSATHGDTFQANLVADSDTSDVLVALGLNGFFEGSTALDIAVREDIAGDPSRISSSATGAGSDTSILVGLLDVKEQAHDELSGSSLGQYYGDIIADLGFQTASTREALIASDAVMQSLETRRASVSGVDVDEELVDLVAFEQAFQAASRFIGVITQLNDELLNLI